MSYKFDSELIKAACGDADEEAIEELSSALSASLERRNALVAKGQTHLVGRGLVIPASLVSNFAYRMLKACHKKGVPPPAELVHLFQLHLGQDRPPGRSERRYFQRIHAVEYLNIHPNAGICEIARVVRVNASTVSRWRKDKKI